MQQRLKSIIGKTILGAMAVLMVPLGSAARISTFMPPIRPVHPSGRSVRFPIRNLRLGSAPARSANFRTKSASGRQRGSETRISAHGDQRSMAAKMRAAPSVT